jgi:hypothetical protein
MPGSAPRSIPARCPARCRSSTTGSPSTPARVSASAGPRVSFGLYQLSDLTGPGRRPRPGADGLARTITPVTGWTWTSLRQEWNDQHSAWRYETGPNFIRDAKHALTRLLAPGWQWQSRN